MISASPSDTDAQSIFPSSPWLPLSSKPIARYLATVASISGTPSIGVSLPIEAPNEESVFG